MHVENQSHILPPAWYAQCSAKAIKSKDLMIRGGVMYAVWDESRSTWASSIYDLVRVVDQAIQKYIENMPADRAALART